MFSTSTTIAIGSSWRAPVPSESVSKAQIALSKCNLGHRFTEISAGLKVDLARDTDLVLALYGVDGPFSPWRILGDSFLDTVRFEPDTPPRRRKQARMPKIRCFAIDSENRLVSFDGGPWRCSGWAYSTVQELITEILYPLELLEPGHAKKALPILRTQVSEAPQLPHETRVEIHRSPPGVPSWKIRTADTLAEILGICAETEAAPTRFSFHICDLANKENGTSHLSHLDHDQVRWHVPDLTAQSAPTAEGVPTDRLGLFGEFDTTRASRPSATA
ncbi:hypothetical protein [Burkholderia sp. MBR-1]|uniref:hypothetical protein n=1 Tax=Burkholderia sp. MBR-1 TaxID=2732364 RepID=UPI0015EE9BB1|nr:hypothetical protein [Burkholderia sp. MBR-1]QMI49913.1 hypothetical protein MBR110_31125 [Burkholderia sp. MBR-1]